MSHCGCDSGIVFRMMDVRRIGGSFGAEVSGIDLRDLDSPTVQGLRDVLAEFRVLVVRDQDLTPAEQVGFSSLLGPLYRMPYIQPLQATPDVIAVLKKADEVNVSTFGSWWHADFSYLDAPPIFSILHARELPPQGGDTLFADMISAYEGLSSGMRALLDPLQVLHSGRIYGTQLASDGDRARMRGIVVSTGHQEADVERAHPVVRVHSPTGRNALFANPTYTTRFENMTEPESKPLLDFLYQHFARPEFTLRQIWRPGDVLIWDNRAVVHLAVNDYDGYRRLLHRTTVGSERPYGCVG